MSFLLFVKNLYFAVPLAGLLAWVAPERTTVPGTRSLFESRSFADVTVEEILGAIKRGDAPRISRYLDNMVDITLQDKTNSYSKTQAEVILRDFFANIDVRGFTVIHRVNSTSGEYCVGMLNTSVRDYKTTILFRMRGDKKLVQELRFE
jgi:hypothetical protein